MIFSVHYVHLNSEKPVMQGKDEDSHWSSTQLYLVQVLRLYICLIYLICGNYHWILRITWLPKYCSLRSDSSSTESRVIPKHPLDMAQSHTPHHSNKILQYKKPELLNCLEIKNVHYIINPMAKCKHFCLSHQNMSSQNI